MMKTKRYIMASLILLIMGLPIVSLAQGIKKYPRMQMLLMEAQLAEIKRNIIIDDRDIPEFERIYRDYIAEITDLNMGNKRPPLVDMSLEGLSDREIEEVFIRQNERAKRQLIIREKYFYEFKKVIPPREIVKLYRIEREIAKKAQNEIRKRFDR